MKKPSLKNLKEKITKKNLVRLGLFSLAAASVLDGGIVYNYAPSNKFTLKSTLGKVADQTTPSGLYLHLPFVQYVHDYHKEVQTIEYSAGGMRFLPLGASTNDQNHLSASMKLNYRVTEDTKQLGYHPWAMDGYILQDGYWILTDMMNQSANAVMGDRPMVETMSDPERFTEEFYEDLEFRFKQNNMPVDIESIEFQKFNTFFSTKTVSYQKFVNPQHKQPTPLQ